MNTCISFMELVFIMVRVLCEVRARDEETVSGVRITSERDFIVCEVL
jgi:hypothetical protein